MPRAAADDWILVFVKAPTPGAVKTRLHPIGADAAAALYRCLVHDTLRVLATLTDARLVVAYAGDRRFPDLAWLQPPRPPSIPQHGATLGERLRGAFQWAFRRGARRVIALGSDAPGLSACWVRRGLQGLRRHDLVIGPTLDGGYQLIGLSAPHPALFARMPWSTSRLLEATLARARELRLSVARLPPIADLDTPDDLWGQVLHYDINV